MRVTDTWPVPRMRPAAAGPITVTKYKAGKPVSVTVLPPPGERDTEVKTGDWRMTVSKNAPERPPLDQSLVIAATHAKRRNRTFTEAGEILNAQRQISGAEKEMT